MYLNSVLYIEYQKEIVKSSMFIYVLFVLVLLFYLFILFNRLILELADGGFRSKLDLVGSVCPEEHARRYVKQILEGLQYLHDNGIVHRDLKIDNILFKGDFETGEKDSCHS